jgi:trimeric autotransporter adhesin
MKQLKTLLTSLVLFSFFGSIYSQVGIGTTDPQAALDITSTNQGLLIPRVSLTANTDVTTVLTPTISELVYNTNTSAVGSDQVTPGYYYWDGSLWIRLAPGSSSNGWSIIGNAGLSSTANFLGTTDDIDVAFRRFNLAAGRIGATSTSFGLNALTSGTATNSSAFGNSALAANTTGTGNAAFGTGALSTNTTTNNSTAVGFNALNVSTNAGNSAFGAGALVASTSGTNNTAIGLNAGANITTGSSNIIIGASANAPSAAGSLQLNIGNTIYGSLGPTIKRITIGGNGSVAPAATLDIRASSATGTAVAVDGILIPRVTRERAQSMTSTPTSTIIYITEVTTADATGTTINVTSPGFYFYNGTVWVQFATGALTGWATAGNAGLSATTNFLGTTDAIDVAFRRNNTAAGRIGATSTSFGVSALTANTGDNNTAFGVNALAANTSSANNTAVGYNALALNTPSSDTGAQNTAVGSGALATLNGGNNNTAVGFNALTALGGLSLYNTAVGSNALKNISSQASQENVAVGYNAMGNTGTTITGSVAVGANALNTASNNTTRNTAIGLSAGSNITSGSDNIVIGANAQVPVASNSNQVRIGGTNITYAGIQVAWDITSDKRWKNTIKDSALGLDFIQTLRPVSYVRNNDEKARTEYGFIAQEIEAALIKAGDPNNAIISKDDAGMYGVRYNDFISISVKAIQEQQEQIEELKQINAALQKTNEDILKRLEALEKK